MASPSTATDYRGVVKWGGTNIVQYGPHACCQPIKLRNLQLLLNPGLNSRYSAPTITTRLTLCPVIGRCKLQQLCKVNQPGPSQAPLWPSPFGITYRNKPFDRCCRAYGNSLLLSHTCQEGGNAG